MKLSKEELKQKINELAVDDDIKITLLEDVEDSFETTEDNNEELKALQTKYEELKEEDVVEEEDIFKIKEEEEE